MEFAPNPDKGCSEFYHRGYRVTACLLHEPDAVVLEIEHERDGIWHTVYYELVSLEEYPRGRERDLTVNLNVLRVAQQLLARLIESQPAIAEPDFLPRASVMSPTPNSQNPPPEESNDALS